MATPSLRYVAPPVVNPQPNLEPEPVIIYDLPTGGGSVAWGDVTGKPAVIGAGADQAAARTAIGAGTSSLAIGTTASTAAAGNHTHAFTALTGTVAGVTGANLQLILNDIATRLAAVETP